MTDHQQTVLIDGQSLTLEALELLAGGGARAMLAPGARAQVEKAAELTGTAAQGEEAVYGVNTGFGRFAEIRIESADVDALQQNLVRSHSAGVGPLFSREVVRAMIVTRANVLAAGCSGVRPVVIETLLSLLDGPIVPDIPSQGSVGASGDLAPLSHLALFLIGEGSGRDERGRVMAGRKALKACGLKPLSLQAPRPSQPSSTKQSTPWSPHAEPELS